jgi:hypothetical protein
MNIDKIKCMIQYEFKYEFEDDFHPRNDFEDTETLNEIVRKIEDGDDAAWFRAKCVARIEGIDLTGTAHLGGCSYNSFEEFELDAYATDMKSNAANELINKITDVGDIINGRL